MLQEGGLDQNPRKKKTEKESETVKKNKRQ